MGTDGTGIVTHGDFKMHMLIRYPHGRTLECILLAASRDRLRLVTRKRNETMELRLVEGEWITEEEDPVQIESLIWDGEASIPAVPVPAVMRASAATH